MRAFRGAALRRFLAVVIGWGWACSSSTGPGATGTHPSGVVVGHAALSGEPYGVAIDAAGTVLVTTVIGGHVAHFQLPDTVSARSDSFPGAGPVHVAINRAGTRAYVVEQFGNAVGVIDLTKDSIVTSVPLTNSGFNIAVRPDDARVYVTTSDGRVYVINAATNTIVDSMQMGTSPNGLAFSPDGQQLYISSRDSGNVAGFHTASDARFVTYQAAKPQRLAVTPDGTHLFVADEDSGVAAIDLGNPSNSKWVHAVGGQYGLAISPDGVRVYSTATASGWLSILDARSGALVDSLNLGGEPRNVAFSADGRAAVITDAVGSVIFIK